MRSAASRFTSSPKAFVRDIVSETTSKASVPSPVSTAVRQTPSTAIESPADGFRLDSTIRRPSSNETTRPRSCTIPVNTTNRLRTGGYPREHRLGVAAQVEDLLDPPRRARALVRLVELALPGVGIAHHCDVTELVAVEHRDELHGRRLHLARPGGVSEPAVEPRGP